MRYNDWRKNNPDSTVKDYVMYCLENDERANLNLANLSRADLSRANLSGAYLSRADLSRANLSGAYLSGAYLRLADLSEANLRWAYLSRADLSRANLRWADLSGAYLRLADLSEANLRWADLSGADLSGADLSGATGPFTTGFFGRHHAVAAGGYISIGCVRQEYDEWLRDYEDIGRNNDYTAEEIADYGAWIKLAVARQRRIEKAAK